MTAGVFLVRVLQAGDPANLDSATGTALLGSSVFVGVMTAVATGWLRTRAIPNLWRRGVTAALCVFGSVLLAVLATAADMAGGAVGLAAYLVLLVGGAIVTHGIARRAAAR